MHEYHAVEEVVKQINTKAQESGALKIDSVTLVIGEQLGFAEESVRLYFESIAEGGLFNETKLIIKSEPGTKFYIDNIEIEN